VFKVTSCHLVPYELDTTGCTSYVRESFVGLFRTSASLIRTKWVYQSCIGSEDCGKCWCPGKKIYANLFICNQAQNWWWLFSLTTALVAIVISIQSKIVTNTKLPNVF